jgi:hypothetical protein
LILERKEARSVQRVIQRLIVIELERIQITPEARVQQFRLVNVIKRGSRQQLKTNHLGDNSNVVAQGIQVEFVCRDSIKVDSPFGVDTPQEREC